ncbi:MAG: hypothetical protein RLZZ230_796 [Candidatus Parcubacteria bacterium]|jgi:hypothetical protein
MNIWQKSLSITLLIFSGSLYADVPWSSTYWWHDLTQSERNQAIVDETYADLNKNVGVSCKEWVRNIVYRATESHIIIPPNRSSPYDYKWANDSTGQVVAMSMPIKDVSPGHIIQMKLSSGWPHTAIVLAKSSTQVTFIESNWDSTPDINSDAVVKIRTVTFSKFYSNLKSPGSYTVYFVQ